jgi:hypothetical protein
MEACGSGLRKQQADFCHLLRHFLHDFLPLLHQHSGYCPDRSLIGAIARQQRSMHRNGR